MPELISIVMASHNRKQQLLNSLFSIQHTKEDYPIEVIVIDDNSDETLSIKELEMFDFPLHYKIRKDRTHQDPVIPNNIGFDMAKGDVILMSCGEILFMGHIIPHVFNYIDHSKYLCYSTYSIGWDMYNQINELDWRYPEVINGVKDIISPMREYPEYDSDCQTGWYVHPIFKPLALSFCAGLTRANMEILSGYDERFVEGVGYADNDFLRRVKDLQLDIEMISDPFCIHQPHSATNYSDVDKVKRNNVLFDELASTHNVKAEQNSIYRR